MRQRSIQGVWCLAAALGLGAATVLTGCGEFFTPVNNSPGGGSASFVYVSNAGGTLAEFSLTSGVLTALSGSPVSLPLAPTAIVVAPNNAFLYVGTATGIFLYTINSDGTLTEGNNDTVVYLNQAALTVASMVVDPTSSWLIVAYQNSTELDALPIDPTTGGVVSITPFIANTTFGTVAPKLAISPANNNIFVALGSGGTNVIGFNPSSSTKGPWGSGVLISPKPGTSDTAVAIDPTSTYMYVTEADLSTTPGPGNLRLFKVSNLGAELPGSPYTTGIGPSAVLVDKSGSYVYVTNNADNTISGYTFDTTSQALTAQDSVFPTEKSPIGLAEDSSKSYVLAVGNGATPNLWLYSFDSTSLGALDVSSTKPTASTSPAVSNGIAVTY